MELEIQTAKISITKWISIDDNRTLKRKRKIHSEEEKERERAREVCVGAKQNKLLNEWEYNRSGMRRRVGGFHSPCDRYFFFRCSSSNFICFFCFSSLFAINFNKNFHIYFIIELFATLWCTNFCPVCSNSLPF